MIEEKLNITIKQMQKSDIDEVVKIEEEAYGEHHWSKDSFYNEMNNNLAYYYCAFDGIKLIGYCGSWQIIDEAHITTIAVKNDYRKKKVGEALLQALFNACYENKIKYVTLEVRVSNEAAINLYKKYNFKSLGVRKGYYQNNGEDALIMWTENIFWDKFKETYEENSNKLKELINIEWISNQKD